MALPVFQAAGAIVETATIGGTIAPAWPAHVAGDVALLFIVTGSWNHHVRTPNGFKEIPSSPQVVSGSGGQGDRTRSVWWCRATSGAMAAPVIDQGQRYTTSATPHNATRAVILTFRGCGLGNPWNACAGDVAESGTTTHTIPGVTTTDPNTLIVAAAVSAIDAASSAIFSGWTNANLTNLLERFDSATALDSGDALGIATGEKAVAGATGSTTVTVTAATRQARICIALTGVDKVEDRTPWLWAIGKPAVLGVAGSIAPAWPVGHQAGDLGFLFVVSGGWPIAVPAGWTHLASSPQNSGVSGAADGTSLNVMYRRAVGGAEAAPSIAFVSSQIQGVIAVVRDAPATGNPAHVEAGDAVASTTAISMPAVTTTLPLALILHFLGHTLDSPTPNLPSKVVSNANLENPQMYLEFPSDVGAGSALMLVKGRKPIAGATGNTTATMGAAQRQSRITIAIAATGQSIIADRGDVPVTGFAANMLQSQRLIADRGDVAFTGFAADIVHKLNQRIDAQRGDIPVTGFPADFKIKKGLWEHRGAATPLWTKRTPRNRDGT